MVDYTICRESIMDVENDIMDTISDAVEEIVFSIGCPHPEWLGIWIDRDGLRVKVTWESWGSFIGWHREWPSGHSCSGYTWDGPFESRWKMIEPAPFESRSHTKQISTVAVGWDPYGLG